MPIRFTCPNCQQRLSVSTQKSGRDVKCPTCRHVVRVPSETSPPNHAATQTSDAIAAALDQLKVADQESELVYASEEEDGASPPDNRMVSVPRRVLYFQGFLLGAVALVFFIFGLAVGSRSSRVIPAAEHRPCTVSGTVLFENAAEQGLPDDGSVAVVLPVSTRPDQKAVADGLAPTDPPAEETHPGFTVIRGLGGDYARIDQRGRYRLRVPAPGRYYLLIVSKNVPRPESNQPKARDLAEIGRYLLPPTRILGSQQYHWKEILLREDQQFDIEF